MSERRYSEAEVATIFERATEAQRAGGRVPLASSDGMTLEALQEIGKEVGLSPVLIEQAAKSLVRTGRARTRSFLGWPIGVERTVELDRKMTDAEWERLVVDLRETFDARGRLRDESSFRSWNNGNLQALLEPMGSVHRLRLKTMNAAARAWMMGGLAIIGVGAVTLIAAITGDVPRAEMWSKFLSMALLGSGAFALGAIRLPLWARKRRQQMEEIAARAVESTSGEGDGNA